MSKIGNLGRKIHGKVTKRPTNFSWVLDEKLAGCGIPTSLDEVNWVLEQGVQCIVTMTENALPESWVKDINYLHVPTQDFTAPDIPDIDNAVDFIHEKINEKKPAMVHCAAGKGRAGTILCCYLIKYENFTAQNAIQTIREQRPGSVQSPTQETVIGLYEKHVRN